MDELDLQIIKKLKENRKLSYKELGKMLNSPSSTIHFRIKRMKEDKIIVGFISIIDVSKLGYKTVGWVGITVDPLETEKIADKIALFEETRMISSTAGAHNIVVQILAEDEKTLWNFIRNNIQTIEGVRDIDVSSTLKVYKWDTYYYFNISN